MVIDTETGEFREYSDSFVSTTNNRMEVSAVLRGLEETTDIKEPISIISDSQYAINCAVGGWSRNKNRDLWKQFDKLSKGRQLQFFWVRGHSGNTYNERCDELASIAMQSGDGKIDEGYIEGKERGREYYERLEKHENKSRMPGGAMGVKIDIPKELEKEPQLGSNRQYCDTYKVHNTCARAICEFYLEGITSFKAYAKLKTGGIDYWSRKGKSELIVNIGQDTWNAITQYFANEKQQSTCAKWVCRGLKPSDAVRKVLVDQEISENCMR